MALLKQFFPFGDVNMGEKSPILGISFTFVFDQRKFVA